MPTINDIFEIHKGSVESLTDNYIDAIYFQGNKIWPKINPVHYLSFTSSNGSNQLTISNPWTAGGVIVSQSNRRPYTIYYSYDLVNWNTLKWYKRIQHSDPEAHYETLSIADGQTVYICGKNPNFKRYTVNNVNDQPFFNITGNGNVSCGGDVMSLIDCDHYLTVIPNIMAFAWLFKDCRSLTTAPVLPATTLTPGCYTGMFSGCTSLTTAPILPATTLTTGCYAGMFEGCTSLTTAPILPATTLTEGCYTSMFAGCTSLTTAPLLPATTLVGGESTSMKLGCYSGMFSGCRQLNYVKCLAKPDPTCTSNWLSRVSSTGTFVKIRNAAWPSGANGIPSGWTVQIA